MTTKSKIRVATSSKFKSAGAVSVESLEQRQLLSATLSTLASFNGVNGSNPVGGLVADASGNLYGTTSQGGATGNDGTVFEIAAGTHTVTTLVEFNGSNGSGPQGSLIADAAGNLYGTTYGGGASGFGTVFKIAAGTHTFTTLASLGAIDGDNSRAGLVLDASGNLYGTTSNSPNGIDDGTVFEIAKATNTLTTLATFDFSNGGSPSGPLLIDASGNIYGTTLYGGSSDDGTVFEIPASTHTLFTLVSFNGNYGDGANPQSGLVIDTAGNIYGTTDGTRPGLLSSPGFVFEIPAGTHSVEDIATLTAGVIPTLIADASGNLYGMTTQGGSSVDGTVYKVAAGTHAVTTLATFTGTNGADPFDSLLADASGNLYGTTNTGGSANVGTVFKLTGSGFIVPATVKITVNAPAAQTAIVGTAKSFSLGSFTETGATGPYTATVAWGDGTTSTIKLTAAGTIPATSHTYAKAATDTVTVTVADSKSHTASSSFSVMVTTAATGTIIGTVFNDANGDKKLDDGELGLGGYTVFIDLKNTGKFATGDPIAVTAFNGTWSFDDLAAGTYKILVEPETGVTATTPTVLTITLKAGATSEGNLFGEKAG